jgi:hypothetical protein
MGRGQASFDIADLERSAPNDLLIGETTDQARRRFEVFLSSLLNFKEPFSKSEMLELLASPRLKEINAWPGMESLKVEAVKALLLRSFRGGEKQPLVRLFHRLWMTAALTPALSEHMVSVPGKISPTLHLFEKSDNYGASFKKGMEGVFTCGKTITSSASLCYRGARSQFHYENTCGDCIAYAASVSAPLNMKREIAEAAGFLPISGAEADGYWKIISFEIASPFFISLREDPTQEATYLLLHNLAASQASRFGVRELRRLYPTSADLLRGLIKEMPLSPGSAGSNSDYLHREETLALFRAKIETALVKGKPAELENEWLEFILTDSTASGLEKDITESRLKFLSVILAHALPQDARELKEDLLENRTPGYQQLVPFLG